MTCDGPIHDMSWRIFRHSENKKSTKLIRVILVDDSELEFHVNVKAKFKEVFNLVVKQENIKEAEYFGLAVIKDGEYIFFDLDDKIQKYAPRSWRPSHNNGANLTGNSIITLHFCVQYYVDQIILLRDKVTRDLYYKQLKKNYVSYTFPRSEESCYHLSSLALQADLGNYDISKYSSTLDLRQFFPAWVVNTEDESFSKDSIPVILKDLIDLSTSDAQLKFIREASLMPSACNLNLYRVKRRKTDRKWTLWLGICPNGINVYEESKEGFKVLISTFYWKDIIRIFNKKKKFGILAKGWKDDRKFIYFTDSDFKTRFLFSLCRLSHIFYIKTRPRIIQLQHFHDSVSNGCHEMNLYNDLPRRPPVIRSIQSFNGPVKPQRFSLISSVSSNTTSGIVSDKFQLSFEGSDEEFRYIFSDNENCHMFPFHSHQEFQNLTQSKEPVTKAQSKRSLNSLFECYVESATAEDNPQTANISDSIACPVSDDTPVCSAADDTLACSRGYDTIASSKVSLDSKMYELKPATYQLLKTNLRTDVIHSLQTRSGILENDYVEINNLDRLTTPSVIPLSLQNPPYVSTYVDDTIRLPYPYLYDTSHLYSDRINNEYYNSNLDTSGDYANLPPLISIPGQYLLANTQTYMANDLPLSYMPRFQMTSPRGCLTAETNFVGNNSQLNQDVVGYSDLPLSFTQQVPDKDVTSKMAEDDCAYVNMSSIQNQYHSPTVPRCNCGVGDLHDGYNSENISLEDLALSLNDFNAYSQIKNSKNVAEHSGGSGNNPESQLLHPELEQLRYKGNDLSAPFMAALINDSAVRSTLDGFPMDVDEKCLDPASSSDGTLLNFHRPVSWHSESFILDSLHDVPHINPAKNYKISSVYSGLAAELCRDRQQLVDELAPLSHLSEPCLLSAPPLPQQRAEQVNYII